MQQQFQIQNEPTPFHRIEPPEEGWSTKVYWVNIIWNDVEQDIAVLAMGKRPLIGTALLKGQELLIQFIDGGLVAIDEY